LNTVAQGKASAALGLRAVGKRGYPERVVQSCSRPEVVQPLQGYPPCRPHGRGVAAERHPRLRC